jgi:hypothetical protein
MPTVGQITQRRAAAVLDLGDDLIINIEYYPDRLSPRMLRQFYEFIHMAQLMPTLEAGDDNQLEQSLVQPIEGLADIVATLLASWDLTETEGGPMVPLTKERLTGFSMTLLMQLVGLVATAMQPGESKGTTPNGHLNGSSGAKHPSKKRS